MMEQNKSKATPGPWRANGLKVEAQNGIVAVCPTPQHNGTFACSDNARLIAAAPTMREALERVVTDLGSTGEPYDSGEPTCVAMARAALRAAAGEV